MSRRIFIIIIVVFICSITSYFFVKRMYILANEYRFNPLELNRLSEAAIDTSLENHSIKRRVVFMGDSRIASWSPPEVPCTAIYNLGIGGQTTQQILHRFYLQALPLKPKVIILQLGINDLKMIPLLPSEKEKIIGNCKRNIELIIDASVSNHIRVIYTSIMPLGKVPLYRVPFWSHDVEQALLDINSSIEEKYDEQALVEIFKTEAVLANENGKVTNQYSKDLLHLTPAGYTALNEKLVPIIVNDGIRCDLNGL